MRQLTLIVSTLVATASNLCGQGTPANLELDHIHIWVSGDAPEAAVHRDLGINQWPDTVAPGEGVDWIGFEFENIFIELLWVVDEELFREKWVSWDSLHYSRANWRSTGASRSVSRSTGWVPTRCPYHSKQLTGGIQQVDGWSTRIG
jgi:hypothetical protein